MSLSDNVRPHRFHLSLEAREPRPTSSEPRRQRLDVAGQPVRLPPLQRIPEDPDRDDESEASTTSTQRTSLSLIYGSERAPELNTSWITSSRHPNAWQIILVRTRSGGQRAVT